MLKATNYVGKYLGGYRITLELASSASSRIFLGESVSPEKYNVAIKRLYAIHIDSTTEQESFLHEARVLKQLRHPHILPILAADIDKGTPYIVDEYAPTGSLRDRLQRLAPKPMEQDEALKIVSQIGQALHYAHQKNIIHGNLKPQNILFNANGEVQLADFKFTSLSVQLYDVVAMSPDNIYIAPEQIEGAGSKKSDQYALGSLAYEMFTGRKPFTTPSANQPGIYYKTKTLIAPTKLNPNLSPRIEQAILKAMAKDPAQRYNNIEEFLSELGIPTVLIVPNMPAVLPNTPDKLRALTLPTLEKGKETRLLDDARTTPVPTPSPTPKVAANGFAQIPASPTSVPTQKGGTAPQIAHKSSRPRARWAFILIAVILLVAAVTGGVIFGFSPSRLLPGSTTSNTTGTRMQPTQSGTGQGVIPATATNTPALTPTGAATNKPQTKPTAAATPAPTAPGVNIPPQPTQSLQPTRPIAPTAVPVTPKVQPTTPRPTPTPTQAPMTATLMVAPSNFNATNCIPSGGSYTCTVNLTLSNAGSSQNWYTYSIGVVTSFSPSKGTIAPGQTISITMVVNDTCTTTGTFVFVGAKTNVTAGWNC